MAAAVSRRRRRGSRAVNRSADRSICISPEMSGTDRGAARLAWSAVSRSSRRRRWRGRPIAGQRTAPQHVGPPKTASSGVRSRARRWRETVLRAIGRRRRERAAALDEPRAIRPPDAARPRPEHDDRDRAVSPSKRTDRAALSSMGIFVHPSNRRIVPLASPDVRGRPSRGTRPMGVLRHAVRADDDERNPRGARRRSRPWSIDERLRDGFMPRIWSWPSVARYRVADAGG